MKPNVIIDEFDPDAVETLADAVQVETWIEMPPRVYAQERKFYFEQLARINNLREVELRVALSNIFCVMMCKSSLWRDR